MIQWWYSIDGSKNGPVSTEALKTLLVESKITPATMVWRDGLDGWVAFSAIDELRPLFQSLPTEPPPINPDDRGHLAALPIAGPWRRFLARIIDMWILGIILGAIFGYAIATQSTAFALWIQKPGSEYAFGWFLAPLILATEAAIFALFGTTPGKAMLCVKVINVDGQKISGKQYLKRQMGVYWYGLGTAFPLVPLFTMARQHWRVKAGKQAGYDEGLYNVKAKKLGIVRVILVTIAVVLLLAANGVLQQIGKSSDNNYYLGTNWKNEVTGRTVAVPAGWIYKREQNSDNQTYYMFSNPDQGMFLVFAKEDAAPGMNLGTYVNLWITAVSDSMVLFPPGQESFINGREAVNISGHVKDDLTQKVKATVVQKGQQMWRVVILTTGGRSPQSDKTSKLSKQFFDSID
jgi:uncharacterized RDD family membrane protein YckC